MSVKDSGFIKRSKSTRWANVVSYLCRGVHVEFLPPGRASSTRLARHDFFLSN